LLQSVEAARHDDVPHSFDTADLLEFTTRELTKGLRGRRAQQLSLTQAAGRAFLLNGEANRGHELLEEALQMARTDQQRAEAHFMIGLLVHQRVGDYRGARDSFQETINYIPAASMTRAQATLGLIRCYAQLGDLEGAEAAYHAALGLGIGEVEPEAQLKFASALWQVGREYKEAIRENRGAHAGFGELGDRQGQHACDSNLVGTYLAMEDYKRAYQLAQQVRDAQESVLDLSRLGTTYGNLALALRHLGRLDEAIEASRQSIRYHHENQQPANKTWSILSLGRTMLEKGDTDRGLAMLQIAADRASQPETIDRVTDMESTLSVP
jgi:tetratricopeptide (TPR) repeat protein